MAQQPLDQTLAVEAAMAVRRYGGIAQASRATGIAESTLRNRTKAAQRLGNTTHVEWTYPAHLHLGITSGSALIGGDCHFWPGQDQLIWQAFVDVAHALKPAVIILNGDIIDGTRVSRHGRLRDQRTPKVSEELDEAKRQIAKLPYASRRVFTLGNHDIRVNTYLANMSPETEDLSGRVEDWFPQWEFAYAATINQGKPHVIPTEVRHYFRQGIHARHNNVLNAGIHMVTNHTHQLGVTPFNNRTGRLYGVEAGMLNWCDAPQFEYHQDMPSRANPGFAVLTYDAAGNLLPPELAEFVHGKVLFRGMSWGHGGKPRISVRAA